MEKTVENKSYNQEEFNQHFDIWKAARVIGNMQTMKEQMNYIYGYCEKFVLDTLWESYLALMYKQETREELIQEVWRGLTENFALYDYHKAKVTTFLKIRIIHEASKYYWWKSWGTTPYYGNIIKKINKVEATLHQDIEKISIEKLAEATGYSQRSVRNALAIMNCRRETSYYNGL